MKRCIAFCLALGAALSLTACGGGDTEGGLLCEASGIRPDTVLLSVDGRDVSAQRYLYWLAYACDYIADYYDSGEGIQWGDTVSGQSLEDYAKDQALQNAALYAIDDETGASQQIPPQGAIVYVVGEKDGMLVVEDETHAQQYKAEKMSVLSTTGEGNWHFS